MKIISSLYVILLILYSFFIIYKYIKFKKITKLKNNNINIKLNDSKGLFIAIPCLREQSCIENTIKYFRQITDLPIVIVTTKKEDMEYNFDSNILTTKDIVEKNIIKEYDEIYLVHYPYEEGYMADQLNYMIDNLSSLEFYDDKKDWYMALYNADSSPSKNSFDAIINAINENNKVIQQYSYCFKNYDNLNFLTKGFAIYQSNFEIKIGLYNSLLNYKFLYQYVVGHGLTINLEILRKMGKFNTRFWCEDIYLTMKCKFRNIKINTILYLENIENAANLKQVMKQNSVWYNTTKKYNKLYKDIKYNEQKTNLNAILGCINEFKCSLNWISFPLITFLNLILTFYNKYYYLFILVLLSYALYVFINLFITIKTINILENKKYKINIRNYFALFFATLISNIGPLYSIFTNEEQKYKTER